MSENTAFPPKLAAALVAVSADVKQLGKSERNKFANYDFVSVDKFYAEIGALMAKHKLHCIPDCVESEVREGNTKYDQQGREKKGAPLLRERWAFLLVHESGEMAGPFHRTVTVPAEGAQAHGSSESYAQKQFLRGVFRVPTGDKDDADYQKAETHAASGRKSSAQAKRDGDHDTIKRMIDDCDSVEGLDARWHAIQEEWLPVLPISWADAIQNQVEGRRAALKAREAA